MAHTVRDYWVEYMVLKDKTMGERTVPLNNFLSVSSVTNLISELHSTLHRLLWVCCQPCAIVYGILLPVSHYPPSVCNFRPNTVGFSVHIFLEEL